MSKANKLTIEDVKAGVELGVDKFDKPLRFGDIVMYTEDCKGRSDIKFGRVTGKKRGNFVISRMEDNLHEDLEKLFDETKRWWYFNAMSKASLTKVSHKFYELWQSKQIFSI